MGPVAEPAPPGARCAQHPSVAATATCARCGNFACQACLVPDGDRLCCTSCGGNERLPLASELSRLGANLIDHIVFFLPGGIGVGACMLHLDGADEPFVLWIAAGGAFCALAVGAINLYMVAQNGASFGKRLVGARVLRSNYTAASWQRIFFLRNVIPGLIGWIPFAGSLFSFADALFIFRADKRCIHDHLADTIVVHVPKQP